MPDLFKRYDPKRKLIEEINKSLIISDNSNLKEELIHKINILSMSELGNLIYKLRDNPKETFIEEINKLISSKVNSNSTIDEINKSLIKSDKSNLKEILIDKINNLSISELESLSDKLINNPKEISIDEINNSPSYWHMQLHEDNPKTPISEIKTILETGYIGLDFGGKNDNKDDYKNSSLKNWYNKTNNKKRVFFEIRKDDIVLIRQGATPVALVRVIGEYEYTDRPVRPMWAKHCMKIELLSYYDDYINSFGHKVFKIPQVRGTLSRSKTGQTYKIIDDWYKSRPINIEQYIDDMLLKTAQKKHITIANNHVEYSFIERLFEFDVEKIEKIEIELKNIKNVHTLNFELSFKKGLYTIVGENGVGKSSLLISLGRLVNGNILRHEFKGDIFNDSMIKYTIDNETFEMKRREDIDKNRVNRQIWKLSDDSRAYIEDIEINKFPKIDGFFESSIISGDRFEHLNRKKEVLTFVDKYNRNNSSIELTSVDEYMKNNLDYIINGKETNKYKNLFIYKSNKWNDKEVYFIEEAEHLISEYSFSTGEYFVLSLLKRISKHRNKNIKSLIIIDEIDISLHPKAQIRLAEKLKEFANEYNLIIIIATHSLPIIDKTEGKNLFYMSRGTHNNIYFENDKKSGLISSYLYEKVIFDRVILVEDSLAREFVEKVINDTVKNNVLYTIIPIGGWEKVLEIYELNKYDKFLGDKILVILDGDVKNKKNYIKNKEDYKYINLWFLPILNVEEYIANTLLKKREFQSSVKSKYLKRNNFDELSLDLDEEFYFNLREKFKKYIEPTSNREKLEKNFEAFVKELSSMKNNLDDLIEKKEKGDKKTIYQKLKNEIIAHSSLQNSSESESQLDTFFIDEVICDLERENNIGMKKFVGRINGFLG